MFIPSFQDYIGEMTTAAGDQERGICQICGREQAVRNRGNITHHGYKVEYGYFHGTCPGSSHRPLQHDKSETEKQIKIIEKDIPEIEGRISKLKSGALHPKKIRTNRSVRVNGSYERETIDWEDASDIQRKSGVEYAIYGEESMLRAARSTLKMLHELIETYYGKALKTVAIPKGEKKKMEVGSVVNIAGQKNVTITKIENRRVFGVGPNINGQYLDHAYWIDAKTGKERSYPLRLARWPKN